MTEPSAPSGPFSEALQADLYSWAGEPPRPRGVVPRVHQPRYGQSWWRGVPPPGPRARRPTIQGCTWSVVRTATSRRPLVEVLRDMRRADPRGSLVLGRVRALPLMCVAIREVRSRLADDRRPKGAAHIS